MVLPIKLDLLSLHPCGEIGRNTSKEPLTDDPMTQQEGPSCLVPHTPVLAHVEINIKVHALEWHVASDELYVGIISNFLDKGLMVHDVADSPDDFPLIRCVWDVADLDFHGAEGERVKEKEKRGKCGR